MSGVWTGVKPTLGDSRKLGDGKGVFVIHACLLHTGNILWFSGHVESSHYLAKAYVWNPVSEKNVATVDFPRGKKGKIIDVFCCFHISLEDGTILLAGGSGDHFSGKDAHGIKDIVLFDPRTNKMKWIGEMKEGRWYPTLVQLGDGSIVAVSGYSHDVGSARVPEKQEIFHPPFRGSTLAPYTTKVIIGADKAFPTYPGLHLAPDGKIYNTGTTWQYNPTNVHTPIQTEVLTINADRKSGSWTNIGKNRKIANREEGASVIMPPVQDGKILVVGGGYAEFSGDNFTKHKTGSNLKKMEVLDTTNTAGGWGNAGPTGEMIKKRVNVSTVLLPDQTVLIIGGHDGYKWDNKAQGTTPHLDGEIYDPINNTITLTGPMHASRTYHSAALLLLDGRVVVAGGVDPEKTEVNHHGNNIPLNQKSYEFYEPEYMHKPGDPRPVLLNLEDTAKTRSIMKVYKGQEIYIRTPQAASIDKVAFMRPGAMTHHTDTQQRYIKVTINNRDADGLFVTAPDDPNLTPAGYYMVWIIDNARLPCKQAFFIQLLDIPAGMSVGMKNHSGTNYRISFDNFTPMLMVDGKHIHAEYVDYDKVWVAHHHFYHSFKNLDDLAKAIIETS